MENSREIVVCQFTRIQVLSHAVFERALLFSLLITISAFFCKSHSQSLAIEPFDSLPGTLHNYQGSSSGWFSEWQNQNDLVGADSYSIIDSSPMSHSEVVSTGNYCVGGGDFTSTGRYLDAAGTFAGFQDINGRIGVGTIYFTFLIRKDEDNDTPIEITFADDPGSAWAINEELIKVGYFGTSSNSGGQRYWSVAAFNETEIDLTDSTIVIGRTYQVIVEINFAATTQVNMWVNPAGGSPDLGNPDASVTSMQDLGFWNIVLYFDANGTGHGSFDEFVFSDNLSVVLPVELTEFYATPKNEKIELHWTTATEISNDLFILERSPVGEFWEEIGKVPGNGDSDSLINYRFSDKSPNKGSNFYRLIQVDYNGARSISNVVRVSYVPETLPTLTLLNVNGEINFVSNSVIKKIVIADLNGKLLFEHLNDKKQIPVFTFGLKDGIYLVTVNTRLGVVKKKILIN